MNIDQLDTLNSFIHKNSEQLTPEQAKKIELIKSCCDDSIDTGLKLVTITLSIIDTLTHIESADVLLSQALTNGKQYLTNQLDSVLTINDALLACRGIIVNHIQANTVVSGPLPFHIDICVAFETISRTVNVNLSKIMTAMAKFNGCSSSATHRRQIGGLQAQINKIFYF